MKRKPLRDYTITLQDNAGRIVALSINADCITEAIASGYSFEQAREEIESNAFGNAIDQKEIGAEAWLVSRS